jgi:hypothetical protein
MFQDISNGVLEAQFDTCLPTKALNIRNFRANATPKVGVHLGIIGLHPLQFPPFVKVCFTPKHTLGLMGLCISHLVTNLMLKLRHLRPNKKLILNFFWKFISFTYKVGLINRLHH